MTPRQTWRCLWVGLRSRASRGAGPGPAGFMIAEIDTSRFTSGAKVEHDVSVLEILVDARWPLNVDRVWLFGSGWAGRLPSRSQCATGYHEKYPVADQWLPSVNNRPP